MIAAILLGGFAFMAGQAYALARATGHVYGGPLIDLDSHKLAIFTAAATIAPLLWPKLGSFVMRFIPLFGGGGGAVPPIIGPSPIAAPVSPAVGMFEQLLQSCFGINVPGLSAQLPQLMACIKSWGIPAGLYWSNGGSCPIAGGPPVMPAAPPAPVPAPVPAVVVPAPVPAPIGPPAVPVITAPPILPTT